jgi:hypothetical protein
MPPKKKIKSKDSGQEKGFCYKVVWVSKETKEQPD